MHLRCKELGRAPRNERFTLYTYPRSRRVLHHRHSKRRGTGALGDFRALPLSYVTRRCQWDSNPHLVISIEVTEHYTTANTRSVNVYFSVVNRHNWTRTSITASKGRGLHQLADVPRNANRATLSDCATRPHPLHIFWLAPAPNSAGEDLLAFCGMCDSISESCLPAQLPRLHVTLLLATRQAVVNPTRFSR